MTYFRRLMPALLLAVIATGCATPAIFQMPEIEESSSNVTSLDFDGVAVKHELLVRNHQEFSALTRLGQYEIRSGEVLLAEGNLGYDMELAGQEQRNIVVPGSISFDAIRSVTGALPEREELPYQMMVFTSAERIGEGSAEVSEPKVLLDTLRLSGLVPLIERPRVYPDTLMLKSFNLAVAELELRIRVVNPGSHPVTLNDISFSLNVDDAVWHTQQIGQAITVPARADIVFDAPFSMRPRNFGTQVYRYLNMSAPFDYTLTGNAVISVTHPAFGTPERMMFTRTGRQQFERLGN
jgi:LEA14-like dessication related protein